MNIVKNPYFPTALRIASQSVMAALLALPFLLTPAPTNAQTTLTPEKQKAMVQCLIGCNKGDANCQNGCTNASAPPAYFSTAGVCVRACADALVTPGQPQSASDDLMTCVKACN